MGAMQRVVGIYERLSEEAQALYKRVIIKSKYRDVFLDPTRPLGREVLHDLLRRTGVFAVSMRGQTELTAYQEGRRSVGLEIMQMLQLGNEVDALKLAMERDDQLNRSEQYFQEKFGTHEDNRG